MGRRFGTPEGMATQAFQFTLDLTEDQVSVVRRQFGGRRYACNWAIRTMMADLAAHRDLGIESPVPTMFSLRKRWNQAKDTECVDTASGELWWRHVSKEAFADGIAGAVDAYWNWQESRAGKREGRRMGFPRFRKKGHDRDRVTFTTGAIRVEPDRRHVTIPRVGTVRTHENTRRLQRLIAKGRARVLAATVSRKGRRVVVAFRVVVSRPQRPRVTRPDSTVGVDVGVRVLATVATAEGAIVERVPNPRALASVLNELRHLGRERSRRTAGSRGYRETQNKLTRLHRRVADIRGYHIHRLTTRLAKTHGTIVVEGLDVAGMLRQRGLAGSRARRRGLSDAALAEPKRQLGYKAQWYGSRLVTTDRWYPSSKTCHLCRHRQDIGWSEYWTCNGCGTRHQRDDNAAINLARYEDTAQHADSVVGPVGAAVKRGADRKTGPCPAVGREARKGRGREPAEQPRDGASIR